MIAEAIPMAGPWYRSMWVRIGGVVFVLGLAVALAVPFLIPVDRFRLATAFSIASAPPVRMTSEPWRVVLSRFENGALLSVRSNYEDLAGSRR